MSSRRWPRDDLRQQIVAELRPMPTVAHTLHCTRQVQEQDRSRIPSQIQPKIEMQSAELQCSVPEAHHLSDARATEPRCAPTEDLVNKILLYQNGDRKSTRLNSSHLVISYAVFCLKKKKK